MDKHMKSLISALIKLFFLSLLCLSASAQSAFNLVTINPGGGTDPSGADGIRFSVNDASASNGGDRNRGGTDQLFCKNNIQYFFAKAGGMVGPVLAVGFASFGHAFNYSTSLWSNVSISGLAGSAATCQFTDYNTGCSSSTATGSGSATITYTALVNG
jgi:hypothetical protein